jgi:hypothetical protein
MNDLEKKLDDSDRKKYGDKEFDQISQCYKVSKEKGDIWCSENIKRYLDRFTRPSSTKQNILTDLIKARNYLDRMITENNSEKYSNVNKTEEIIENFKNE